MVSNSAPRPYNVQLYQQRNAEIDKADESGNPRDFMTGVGFVTTTFEHCESLMATLLREVTGDAALIAVLFDNINARSTRNQVISGLIEQYRPKRRDKLYERVEETFRKYAEMGGKRDEVAHSMLSNHHRINFKTGARKRAILLVPGSHIDRKHVAGTPKYHYDLPALEKLCRELNAFVDEVIDVDLALVSRRVMRRQRLATRAKAVGRQPPK